MSYQGDRARHLTMDVLCSQICSVLHCMTVIPLAYVLADFGKCPPHTSSVRLTDDHSVYYFCNTLIADESSSEWGQLSLYTITVLSCLVVPPLCCWLGGEAWVCTEGRWWQQRLRNFFIEEIQWVASYNIWYGWLMYNAPVNWTV